MGGGQGELHASQLAQVMALTESLRTTRAQADKAKQVGGMVVVVVVLVVVVVVVGLVVMALVVGLVVVVLLPNEDIVVIIVLLLTLGVDDVRLFCLSACVCVEQDLAKNQKLLQVGSGTHTLVPIPLNGL